MPAGNGVGDGRADWIEESRTQVPDEDDSGVFRHDEVGEPIAVEVARHDVGGFAGQRVEAWSRPREIARPVAEEREELVGLAIECREVLESVFIEVGSCNARDAEREELKGTQLREGAVPEAGKDLKPRDGGAPRRRDLDEVGLAIVVEVRDSDRNRGSGIDCYCRVERSASLAEEDEEASERGRAVGGTRSHGEILDPVAVQVRDDERLRRSELRIGEGGTGFEGAVADAEGDAD